MALETDLSVSPYFDDFDDKKDFYKILFRPGVSVQTRELNQLQTILQTQIERFGDNIFKRGTIIDGCNFLYYSSYPYIKINDLQKDGLTADPSSYVGYFAKSVDNNIGVVAYITNYQDGFEATTPDLKTLYLNYINSGNNGTTNTFSAGEVITIYDQRYPIFSAKINNGGISFSNSDTVVVTSAIVVNVSTGTFTTNEYLYQPSTGANVQIYNIDTTTLASSNQVILYVRPRTVDLTNAVANSTSWTIANAESVRNATSTVTATVESIIGSGAEGQLLTDSSGKVVDITITSRGVGYSSLPNITIKSPDNSTGLSTLSITAQNYLANVQISSLSNPVGNGYAFGVTEGIIYQKGYFSRVSPQTIIVEKYNQSPSSVVVGFDTREEIIDSNIDPSLLDNVLGTENVNAPGANRLKLTPELVVMTSESAAANDSFFVISEWSEGRPFRQNKATTYNKINDELAKRSFEESGNYSIDKFRVTTRSPANTALEGNTFSIVVDPGLAYIEGYRVESKSNFVLDTSKGNDVQTTNNQLVSLDFENFVRLKEVGGNFQFSTGDVIKLYDSAKNFITNTVASSTGNTNPVGNLIGTANMRSLLYSDGTPGTANAIYKLYLFNVTMNSGKNFRDVKSVYYDGTNKGIADLVLTLDGTLNSNIAVIEGIGKDSLIFPSGVYSLKSSSNNTYTYRTIDQTLTVANNTGRIIKDISSIVGEYYPYGTNLTDFELKQLYLVPTSNNLTAFSAEAGTVSVLSTSPNVTGTSTTFLTSFQVGDHVKISNGSSNSINRISSIVNNTLMILASNCSFTQSVSTYVYRCFPEDVPISLGARTVVGQNGHSANINSAGNILTIQFKYANGTAMTFDSSTSVAANVSLSVNIERRNVTPLTKTATRKRFVKIRVANNVANTIGPWCLGVPDAFRLRGVYVGNSSVDNTFPNSVNEFYIDHNQTSSFYDLSFLYKKPSSSIRIDSSDYFMVEFDYGESSFGGFFNTVSYTGEANSQLVANNDSLALSQLTTKYNTFEIPEVHTNKGEYFDLINTFDFRPLVSNTVAPSASHTTAPVNPPYTISFGTTSNPANDKKFPVPQSLFRCEIDQYLGRIDSVFVDRDANIFTIKGNPNQLLDESYAPETPKYSMRLNNLVVKPYPNISKNSSNTLSEILNRRIANERYLNTRIKDRIIETPLSERDIEREQPTGFTMADIGNISRRVSDLEYYVSLSLLETNMKDKVIPSSLDPALNRFKYGFFVDDFSTNKFSDRDNPQYSATVEQDDILPEREIFTIKYPTKKISCDYIDQLIISQDNATTEPPPPPPPPPPVSNTTGPIAPVPPTPTPTPPVVTGVSNNWLVRHQSSNRGTLFGREEVDYLNVTMSTVAAPVSLYGHFYSGPDKIEIFQGNTLVYASNSAVNLTTADKTKLKSNVVPSGWFNTVTFQNFSLVNDSRGQGVRNSFKITWTHNPSNGLNYTIKTTKYSIIWRYALEYPINSNTVSSNTAPNTSPQPVIYNGTMIVTPDKIDITYFS